MGRRHGNPSINEMLFFFYHITVGVERACSSRKVPDSVLYVDGLREHLKKILSFKPDEACDTWGGSIHNSSPFCRQIVKSFFMRAGPYTVINVLYRTSWKINGWIWATKTTSLSHSSSLYATMGTRWESVSYNLWYLFEDTTSKNI